MDLRHTATRSGPLLSFLRDELGLSSTLVKRLKAAGAFRVNGQAVFTDHAVAPGDRLTVRLAEARPDFPPEDGPLSILYEDEALLALDKPAGLFVHPTAGRNTGTLANLAAGYFAKTGQACGVHPATRLDRDTFGVCLLAKNAHVHALLCRSQREGRLEKTYLAAVAGAPPGDAGVVSAPIARRGGGSLLREARADGQPARTEYRTLSRTEGLSLLVLRPVTGRTHQLRVHCAHLGCPILGDRPYGTPASLALAEALGIRTQQLLAARLALFHPLTGAPLEISSRLRPYFPGEFRENFLF